MKYEVIKKVGEGSFGKAYLIKCNGEKMVLKRQRICREMPLEVIQKEVDILKGLHCRYLVHIYEGIATTDKGKSYYDIYMEYCEYKSLSDVLDALSEYEHYLSTLGVLKYFTEMLMGLKYIHNHHILHRDLKPDNIFITTDNVCILGDFGFAKQVEDLEALNRTYAGSPMYMAPEVFRGNKYNSKADIWSLGCILYEICTFKAVYEKAQTPLQLKKLQKIPFRELGLKLPKHLDNRLYDLIDKCLQINPADRLSANELYNEEIIQNFISQDCVSLNYSYDTKMKKDMKPILDVVYESINKKEQIEVNADSIKQLFETFSKEKSIDKKIKQKLFKIVQYCSKRIGRQLLLDPYDESNKVEFVKIDSYEDRKNEWERNVMIHNIFMSILEFFSKQSYHDECFAMANALMVETGQSKEFKDDFANYML